MIRAYPELRKTSLAELLNVSPWMSEVLSSSRTVWWFPRKKHLRQLILKEAHESPLTIHPGSTKMYQDLRQRFWWTRMKREIAQYIASCDVCRCVKAKHLRLLAPFNLWLSLNGNGIKSVWISSLGFPGPREGIMPSSS